MIKPTLLSVAPLPNGYGTLRLHAPDLARAAAPGHRVQLNGQTWPLISASAEHGWIELFHAQPDFSSLAETALPTGSEVELGPLKGEPIDSRQLQLPAVLVGDVSGLASLMFLLSRAPIAVRRQCLVFLQSDHAFPFSPRPSQFMVPGVPPATTGCAPLCEDTKIPSRLASLSGLPGCYDGSVVDLLAGWLSLRGRGMIPQPHIYVFCDEGLARRLAEVSAEWQAQFHRFIPNAQA